MSDDNRADDNRANDNDDNNTPPEDRLPWLEAVEEDGEGEGPSLRKLLAVALIGLVAIGVILGGIYWLGNHGPSGSGNDVITAERGDYKQHPENPGGMNLSGEGNTSVAASEGQAPRGNINLNGVAEQPAAPARPAPAPAPQHPAPAPAPAPQHPAPAPAPSGPAIQLGAFSTPAAANGAWTALAGRFRYLAPLAHNVVPVQVGGRTLQRLRASGPGSADICRRLQAAGEACTLVN